MTQGSLLLPRTCLVDLIRFPTIQSPRLWIFRLFSRPRSRLRIVPKGVSSTYIDSLYIFRMSESGRPRTFTVLLFVLKISRFTGSVVFLQCFRPPLDNLTCEELINCNTSSGILSSLRFLWFRDDFRLYEYRRYPPLDFSFLGGSTFPFHLFLVTRMTSHCHETFFLTGFDSVPLGFSEYRQFKPFLGSSWLPRVSRVFEVGTGRNPKVVSCKPILTVIPLFLT